MFIRPLLSGALFLIVILTPPSPIAAGSLQPLSVTVLKGTTGLCTRKATCHKDRAGTWTPTGRVAIVAVSIPEQTDISLYTDIEISTNPVMYAPTGHIFRTKYAGPGLFDYGARSGNTYLGSNITTTNIAFPMGYGIVIEAGATVYMHLDVINQSLIDVAVNEDCYIYYVPA